LLRSPGRQASFHTVWSVYDTLADAVRLQPTASYGVRRATRPIRRQLNPRRPGGPGRRVLLSADKSSASRGCCESFRSTCEHFPGSHNNRTYGCCRRFSGLSGIAAVSGNSGYKDAAYERLPSCPLFTSHPPTACNSTSVMRLIGPVRIIE
jgi:hypothetical protein